MFTKNKLIHFLPVFGNFILMLLTYYYFSWSVLFLFFFFVLETSFFDFFQYLKNQNIAKQFKIKGQQKKLLNTLIILFVLTIVEFVFLGFSLLFEDSKREISKELISFFMYEEFGIKQGYFLLPILLLGSFMKSKQERNQGLGAYYLLDTSTTKKAFIFLNTRRAFLLVSALFLSILNFKYAYLMWMLIFSVLMAQRVIFWKKIEITAKGYSVYN